MALYGRFYDSSDTQHKHLKSTIYPYFSANGLRWNLAVPAPKGETFTEKEDPLNVRLIFEIGGLYKFGGLYYVAGQEFYPDIWMPDGTRTGRVMVTHWSGDFVQWSRDRALSYVRYGYRSKQDLNEAHEPAGIWNRNNVLLGTFGLWQGAKDNKDRRMPLGFLVSNDGIHFREPQPDFEILQPGADGQWDQRGLIHGQGYENVGDKTYIYYGAWDLSNPGDPEGAVGLATLRRDGFGYLSVKREGEAFLTTIPMSSPRGLTNVKLNADGLGNDAVLRVELLDAKGKLVPGFTGKVSQSGLAEPVRWAQTNAAAKAGSYRLRLYFEGNRKEQIKFYAAYLE
jgi:hypothetical protein